MELDYCLDRFQDLSLEADAEDKAFYAELTRQMLLLTDEDDEVDTRSVGILQQRLAGQGGSPGPAIVPGNCFGWSEVGFQPAPRWMERLWENSAAGTGVFIPQVVAGNKSRRRHSKQKKDDRGRTRSAAGNKIHV